MHFYKTSIILFILAILLAACSPAIDDKPAITNSPASMTSITPLPKTNTPTLPVPTSTPTETPTPSTTPSTTPTPGISGPNDFPEGISPLTGLQVNDPSLLSIAPGLISISNAPFSTRPQSGLSYASQVYEFYLGEGDTRFLSVFYGNLPPNKTASGEKVEVGPIRSGRLLYATLREFYRGFLVFASASDTVLSHLNNYQIIQNPNIQNINGATISIDDMVDLGKDTIERVGKPQLNGLRFDPTLPEGGKDASQLCVAFHPHSMVYWKYDPQSAAYTRWQNDGEGTPQRQFSDQINQSPLAFSNIIVMFTNYIRYTDTYFNIEFNYITRYPALLFRDGKMYEMYWTTRNEEYEITTGKLRPPRFIDYDGNPYPLKPGQTWIELVQLHNAYYETNETEDFYRLINTQKDGTGFWTVIFTPPDYSPTPTAE